MGGEPPHRTTAPPAEPAGPACREQLLAAARAVADRLDRLALRGDLQANAHWIGLKPVGRMQRHWVLEPLGLDLYGGVPGVALFLAYLGEVAGEVRYTTLARAATTTVRCQVARGRASITSIGGFDGWGGVIYVLAHLAALWGEPALYAEAEALVGPLHALIEKDEYLDIIKGAAGGIGGLLSLYRCTRSEHALAVAIRCGDWLIQRAQPQVHGLGWATKLELSGRPLAGFSHGAAGMAWALVELAAADRRGAFPRSGVGSHHLRAQPVLARSGELARSARSRGAGGAGDDGRAKFRSAWCHGAPGIGLARLRLLSHLDTSETRSEIDVALQTTLARGFGDNHSLCHGDLGNLELLLQAGQVLPNPQWKLRTGRIASMILESIETRGWVCGVPLGAETPGLMTGLAGIGYGLLRWPGRNRCHPC